MILLSRDSAIETVKNLFVRSAIFGMERGGMSQFNWNAQEGKESMLLSVINVCGDEAASESLSLHCHRGKVCFKTTNNKIAEKFLEKWQKILDNDLFDNHSENLFVQRTKHFKLEMKHSIDVLTKKEIRNVKTKKAT